MTPWWVFGIKDRLSEFEMSTTSRTSCWSVNQLPRGWDARYRALLGACPDKRGTGKCTRDSDVPPGTQLAGGKAGI